ncbi:7703_t:CDS:2 [Racocetra persica]|uniref:7703_t:CDS:1 n=1 Tax=Racocetra persica TaxID=160502 RepID=A0ACA9LJB6_9GLOM|nr:7703_t:CDS:2 [Racocetra persica]
MLVESQYLMNLKNSQMKTNGSIKSKNKIKLKLIILKKDVVTDNNPAVYVVLTAEVSTTPFLTINTFLNRQQREEAKEILLNNHQIFTKNISEEGQTFELGQTKENS